MEDIQHQPESAQGSDPTFAHIPYEQRWESLKPTIIKLYMEEKEKIPRVSDRMKAEYKFDAVPSQYRYRFRQWGIKKRITTEEKDAIINAYGKRLQPGSSLSQVSINEGGINKGVDKKALKRYIGDCIRHEEDIQIDYAMPLRWNLPYSALLTSLGLPHDQPSPFETSPHTPQNMTIESPESSASTGPSPGTQLVQRKIYLDRAKLLLQGREMDLMRQLKASERETTITWLHERWLYSFLTAKYWGKGPRHWTAQTIEFKMGTDKGLLETSSPSSTSGSRPAPNETRHHPRAECHWTIHHRADDYEPLPDVPDDEPDKDYDIEDESTWPTWKNGVDAEAFSKTISEGLESNTFSKCSNDDVPLSLETLSQQREKSTCQRNIEEFSFAIVSRNLDLFLNLEKKIMENDGCNELGDILPEVRGLHLAATYLDGSRQCCMLFDAIQYYGEYYDQFGHTVLDNIFITILRSHTNVAPSTLSRSFRAHTRFAGEEVDICGRWDVDSPCVRELYASGQSRIPFSWKHEFCHTSVQAICHSITNIFLRNFPPAVNQLSGLFNNICEICGHESSTLPLHALVFVASYLANNGTKNETLYGALACLVCLIWCGANPFTKADIILPGQRTCDHQPTTPLELAEKISPSVLSKCSGTTSTGWSVFISVLRYISTQHNFTDLTDIELSKLETGNISLAKWDGLGLLWGAIQAEFLSHRKVTDLDGALSMKFDMNSLLQGLEAGQGPINIDWIRRGLMNPVTNDGYFGDVVPRVNEVCKEYCANVEQWGRIRFIGVPYF